MCSLAYFNPELVDKIKKKKEDCICNMEDLENAGDEYFCCKIAED